MPGDAVLVGVGEMGGIFAKALLRAGASVHPVLRDTDRAVASQRVPEPELVLVTVAEADLHPALRSLPPEWRTRTGLLQNELLPRDWTAHHIVDPTVAVVWFEKKKGQDVRVITASPIGGPAAQLLVDALATCSIPAHVVSTDEELLFALVEKNCYILTANIAGLETGGSVGELWAVHEVLATAVFDEIVTIQEHLTGEKFDRDRLLAGMVAAFEADPGHGATGRSAPSRLERALSHATDRGVQVPTLREIGQAHGVTR
jgi:ketopantoate reductase